jgi:hypothetical protein
MGHWSPEWELGPVVPLEHSCQSQDPTVLEYTPTPSGLRWWGHPTEKLPRYLVSQLCPTHRAKMEPATCP